VIAQKVYGAADPSRAVLLNADFGPLSVPDARQSWVEQIKLAKGNTYERMD
jgi:hypothetical protein